MRTYEELASLETFEDRFEYLKIQGSVGVDTFGYERWLNQNFYRSREWKHVRARVIARDLGNDLGIEGRPVFQTIQVHHINPMRPQDIRDANIDILNPRYLISVSHETHNAIHYGTEPPQPIVFIERKPGDTIPWKK